MFTNRQDAGQKLGRKLLSNQVNKELDRAVILAVPRGGVIVGKAMAEILHCPLDIIITKKIPCPANPELAIGAVGETRGSIYYNRELIAKLGVDKKYLKQQVSLKQKEIKQQEAVYRQNRQAINLQGKVVILTDDGAATGASLIAALREIWNNSPKKVVVALPVAPAETVQKLEKEADEVEVLQIPDPFFSVSQVYQDFTQVSDII